MQRFEKHQKKIIVVLVIMFIFTLYQNYELKKELGIEYAINISDLYSKTTLLINTYSDQSKITPYNLVFHSSTLEYLSGLSLRLPIRIADYYLYYDLKDDLETLRKNYDADSWTEQEEEIRLRIVARLTEVNTVYKQLIDEIAGEVFTHDQGILWYREFKSPKILKEYR